MLVFDDRFSGYFFIYFVSIFLFSIISCVVVLEDDANFDIILDAVI